MESNTTTVTAGQRAMLAEHDASMVIVVDQLDAAVKENKELRVAVQRATEREEAQRKLGEAAAHTDPSGDVAARNIAHRHAETQAALASARETAAIAKADTAAMAATVEALTHATLQAERSAHATVLASAAEVARLRVDADAAVEAVRAMHARALLGMQDKIRHLTDELDVAQAQTATTTQRASGMLRAVAKRYAQEHVDGPSGVHTQV